MNNYTPSRIEQNVTIVSYCVFSLHWLPRDFTVILTCYVSLQS